MSKRNQGGEAPVQNKKLPKRMYSSKFLNFGFIQDEEDEQKPFCLICPKTLTLC